MVSDGLRARWADLAVETKIITTSGDENNRKIRDAVQSAGRKGLFTAEIERALLAGDVDLAVHSAKDLPSELTAGTEIAAVLPRAPVDDVLISIMPWDLHSLPANGIVATGSVRRKHQLRWKRPDLEIVDLRGNVMTRLRKLAIDQWHAIILARAGLERLGLETNFFVRSDDEWNTIIEKNPFRSEAKKDPGHLLVLLSKDEIGDVRPLQDAIAGREIVRERLESDPVVVVSAMAKVTDQLLALGAECVPTLVERCGTGCAASPNACSHIGPS